MKETFVTSAARVVEAAGPNEHMATAMVMLTAPKRRAVLCTNVVLSTD